MPTNIFDTHAHYDDEAFDEDRKELLLYMRQNGVTGIINCGTTAANSKISAEYAESYDFIRAAAGIHPHYAAQATEEDFAAVESLLSRPRVVAVGEMGLDYHYDYSPREAQLRVAERLIEMAARHGKPIIFHDREAHEDTLELLKKHRPRGVLHCFSGSVEMAAEILKLGMYIGLGGAVTFKNAKTPPLVAAFVPEDRLLLETDAPYMTPEPFRGKRCDSLHINLTAEKIAVIRGVGVQELLDMTAENAKKMFLG